MRFVSGLLFLLFLIVGDVQSDEKVRLTNGEWAPYLSKTLPKNGVVSLIVKEAFKVKGINVDYGFFPWKRAYILAERGDWDGSVVWIKTPERSANFLYSDVVISETLYLFHHASRPLTWEQPEDLRGLTVGVTLHTAYPTLSALEKKGIIKLKRAGDYKQLFQRLFAGRVDVVPLNLTVGLYYLRRELPKEAQTLIKASPTQLPYRDYHLILSKAAPDSERYLALFNEGLRTLKASGRYDQIMRELEENLAASGHSLAPPPALFK